MAGRWDQRKEKHMTGRRKFAALFAMGLVVAGVALGVAFVLPHGSQAAGADSPSLYRGLPGEGSSVGDSYLADALGITTEELASVRQSAAATAIQKAVDDGLITQAQADALTNHQSLGARWLMPMKGTFSGIDGEALLADALGISVTDLQAAQSAAATARLDQAIADGDITQEQADLVKARQALQKYFLEKDFIGDALKQAVTDGIITQEQADTFLNKGGLGLGRMGGLDGYGSGPLMGGRGGMRHGGMGLRDSWSHRFELEPSGKATPRTAPSSSSSSSSTGARL